VASLTAEVDGQYSQRLNAWSGFPGFAVGLGRWLLGGDPPSGMQATIRREGGQGIVRLDLDPERPPSGADAMRAATAAIVPPDARDGAAPERLPLVWVGDDALEARFPLQKPGLYLGAVQLAGGGVLPLAPLNLPYSPEFEPRSDPDEGRNALREVARITGGVERTAWDDAFESVRLRNRQVRDLVLPLTLLLIVLHVSEIAGRRLLLFPAIRVRARALRLPRVRLAWRRRRKPSDAPASAASTSPAATAPEPPPVPPARPVTSSLERAKAKARERLGR
jgi:hypothetical protein